MSIYLLFAAAICGVLCGCQKKAVPRCAAAVQDEPLATYQNELLSIAFEVASAIPSVPHIKTRSAAQEAVVMAHLELDQPLKASLLTERIESWRQGMCYANIAFYFAQHGLSNEARNHIGLAEKVLKEDLGQEWRNNRISIRIRQARTLLDGPADASEEQSPTGESETDKAEEAAAIVADANSFDQTVARLEAMIASGNFDVTRHALKAYARLFESFYDDESRRNLVESKIRESSGLLPVQVRADLYILMAEAALNHSDNTKCLALIKEIQLAVSEQEWPVEQYVPLMGRLIELRYRAGDVETARREADRCIKLFESRKDEMVNLYRAPTLRAIAQAYQVMGDSAKALSVYRQVVEEGLANPNSRPRAQELSATCISMALYGVEPDAELMGRIHQIRDGLGEPW
ncbi:MAG TPA: hypothetical protein VLH60_03115 [Sedimentisphaerales bacterium]|nr:hypothetical protein [Sedimentisphaerales bacterium]